MARTRRDPVTVDRILDAAESVAADSGMTGVSMRSVARALGVEAMSLYHHVENKERLLDAMAERLSRQISPPPAGASWRDGLRHYARSQFNALRSRPWGLALLDSRRNPGPEVVAVHEGVLACLRANGFPLPAAASAFSIVDSYIRGFVLTLHSLPFTPGDDARTMAKDMEAIAALAPNLTELATALSSRGDYDYAEGFEAELEVVIEGIAVRLAPA